MASVPGDPSVAAAQSAFAIALFDEFARGAMTDVVVCPGSRSTPLVLAAGATPGLRLHVRLDERSAGFFAIGLALASRAPVGVVVTSGTAAAELTAAVVEADLADVPLVVVTADRPPELRGAGAPQTIDQVKLYGSAVRTFEDPGPIRPGTESTWRPLACRVLAASQGSPSGPVHLNVALVEPLDTPASAVPVGRPHGAPWRRALRTHVAEPAASDSFRGQRVLVIAGRGSASPAALDALVTAHRWPVLADPLSGGRGVGPFVVAGFDAILRDAGLRERLRPDVVVLLGAMPASRALSDAIVGWESRVVAIGDAAARRDPAGVVAEVVDAHPTPWATAVAGATDLEAPAAYAAAWRAADDAAQGVFDESLDTELSEPAVARLLSRAVPHGVGIVVSSSMPVRDLEWFGASVASPPLVFANRGANGIDGVVSTTLGVAAGSRAVGLLGDLAFLHDAGALADGLGDAVGTCVLVVLDNRGGGIFSFLPQRRTVPAATFERLFATPPRVDVASVAAGYGADVHAVKDLGALDSALAAGLAAPGVTVIVATLPDRDANVELHDALSARAASAAAAAAGR